MTPGINEYGSEYQEKDVVIQEFNEISPSSSRKSSGKSSLLSYQAREILMDKNKDNKSKILKVIEISRFIYEKYEAVCGHIDQILTEKVDEQSDAANTQEMIQLQEAIESRDNKLMIAMEDAQKKDTIIME